MRKSVQLLRRRTNDRAGRIPQSNSENAQFEWVNKVLDSITVQGLFDAQALLLDTVSHYGNN